MTRFFSTPITLVIQIKLPYRTTILSVSRTNIHLFFLYKKKTTKKKQTNIYDEDKFKKFSSTSLPFRSSPLTTRKPKASAPHFKERLCTCMVSSKKIEAYCLKISTDSVVRKRQVAFLVQSVSISGCLSR